MKTMKKTKAVKGTEAKSKIRKMFLTEAEKKAVHTKAVKGDIRQLKVYNAFNSKTPSYERRTTTRANKQDALHEVMTMKPIQAGNQYNFSDEVLHHGGASPRDRACIRKTYKLDDKGLKIRVDEFALLHDPKEKTEKNGGFSKRAKIFTIIRK